MAKTAEQALEAAVPAIGADRSKKYRDIIHLPMHQIGAKFEETFAPFISTEAEVPEFVDDHWDETRPDWARASRWIPTGKWCGTRTRPLSSSRPPDMRPTVL